MHTQTQLSEIRVLFGDWNGDRTLALRYTMQHEDGGDPIWRTLDSNPPAVDPTMLDATELATAAAKLRAVADQLDALAKVAPPAPDVAPAGEPQPARAFVPAPAPEPAAPAPAGGDA